MTVTKKGIHSAQFMWASGDIRPTRTRFLEGIIFTPVPIGATGYEHDTGIMYITHDGDTWVEKDTIVKTTAFSIGGVNFDDYTKIKTLWLPSTCDDNSHVNMKSGATNYQVPSDAVFIALRVTASIYGVGTLGIFGWSGTEGGDIGANQDILSVSCGLSATGFMNEVLGVFPAGKWVKARTDHGSSEMYANSALYGVEVPNGS